MSDTDRELDNLLRAANPIDEGGLPMPSESPSAQLLYEKITGTPYGGSARRPQRRWKGLGLAALLAVAGGGAAAAAAYAISSHVTTHLAVTCYGAPSLESHALVVPAEAAGPVATCSRAWADGRLGTGPVPLLVACATPQGVAAVLPSALGADVCGQLGLPALPAGASSFSSTTAPTAPPTPPTDAAGTLPPAVRDAIIEDLRSTCSTSADAERAITKLLAKANVKWTVVTPTPFPTGRPCASPGFDEDGKRVVLTGIPPLSPP
ncbi:MAG: hypothetical protein QOK20_1125 [Acidimicrobiaceae bacterium]|nr:hypothetical protein [Acidimicrobiaceae bacterium]